MAKSPREVVGVMSTAVLLHIAERADACAQEPSRSTEDRANLEYLAIIARELADEED